MSLLFLCRILNVDEMERYFQEYKPVDLEISIMKY